MGTYIEIFIVGAIFIFIFFYTGKVSAGKFVADNKDLFNLLKEKDYEFLLYAKYGDRVYDPNQVFKKRVSRGLLATLIMFLIFLSKLFITSSMALLSPILFTSFTIVFLKLQYSNEENNYS